MTDQISIATGSSLKPFIRNDLDILFVGLNPAKGSSDKGHYLSVNQSFWNQLHKSGLITCKIDKSKADEVVFGSTNINFQGWAFGITDLVTSVAESDSSRIKPTKKHCEELIEQIRQHSPRVVIILHQKATSILFKFLRHSIPTANAGQVGALIEDCSTMFFAIAFPHGNAISEKDKVKNYQNIRKYLEARQQN